MHKKEQVSKTGMCVKTRIWPCWKPTLTFFSAFYLSTWQFAEVSFKYAIKFSNSTLDLKVLPLNYANICSLKIFIK